VVVPPAMVCEHVLLWQMQRLLTDQPCHFEENAGFTQSLRSFDNKVH
jgi:hypothetical protein